MYKKHALDFHLTGMLSSGFGHVVNMSSVLGKFATTYTTPYSATKFGLIGMMDAVRHEVCLYCVCVCVYCVCVCVCVCMCVHVCASLACMYVCMCMWVHVCVCVCVHETKYMSTLPLSFQLIDKNVFVTNVCPGPVRTAAGENSLLGDGSLCNKKNPLLENGMTVQRCLPCCVQLTYKLGLLL